MSSDQSSPPDRGGAESGLIAPPANRPPEGRSRGVLLYGWYGGGNIGDEAVLAALVQMLHDRTPDLPITALSVNPTQTARLHGITALKRGPLSAHRATQACATFALGGGGTVQDVTSAWNLPSFLLYPLLAARLGKRVVWSGVGVGPLGTRLGRWLAARAAGVANAITVRDAASADLLAAVGAPARRITITADPALALRPAAREDAVKLLQAGGVYIAEEKATLFQKEGGSIGNPNGKPRAANLVVFALRRPLDPQLGRRLRPGYLLPVSVRERLGAWSRQAERLYQQMVDALAQLADYCISEWQAEALFVPFDTVDRKVAAAVRRRMRFAEHSHELVGEHHPALVMSIVGLADLVVAMRLHGLIFGAAMGRPLLALSYDRKVSSFMTQLGAGEWVLPLTDRAALLGKAAQLWRQREAVAQQIGAQVAELKRKAIFNADIIEAGGKN